MTSGLINNQPVVFLLDTGATNVSVPGHLASRLGLQSGAPQRMSTANGSRIVYQSTIDSLNIGNINLYNVAANLNDGMQGEHILLGMSALKQLNFVQKDGWLYHPNPLKGSDTQMNISIVPKAHIQQPLPLHWRKTSMVCLQRKDITASLIPAAHNVTARVISREDWRFVVRLGWKRYLRN